MDAVSSSSTVVETSRSEQQRVEPGLLTLLADHDIHQSLPQPNDSLHNIEIGGQIRPPQADDFDPTLAAHPQVVGSVSNPAWWESTYRRVPPYRPANRELDLDERRQNPVFQVVGSVMAFGCMTVALGMEEHSG
ncbi:hypothetical protein HBI12_113500 [Parastagonospora nodorum]|nr:hypothetical protein HBI12_113500 [Parastagonospora nodorum]KAH5424954.1 hypothetical protein HBI47_124280 [Parastagonospora nodorum]